MSTSTLGFALLGLLARVPLSGYDIAAQLKHGVGPFWHARHSQIYPELARLEAAGLVSHERVEQHDRPDKKVFTVTAKGVDALADWVAAPIETAKIRDELTLRAYSVWLVDPQRAAKLFAEQADKHRQQLTLYEQSRVEMERDDAFFLGKSNAPEFANYATLRRGIAYERELVEWCDWLAEALLARTPAAEPTADVPLSARS